jgi:Ca2+-binding RTX toxin-like protein
MRTAPTNQAHNDERGREIVIEATRFGGRVRQVAALLALMMVAPLLLAAAPPARGVNCGQKIRIEGTDGNDVVPNTAADEAFILKAGNDDVQANAATGRGAGDDCLIGDEGDDRTLRGGDDNDLILAGPGNDRASGGGDEDQLNGGDGNDQLFPEDGRDVVNAGDGDDLISAARGDSDIIRCGEGLDTVTADPTDELHDCELVTIIPLT